MDAQKANTDADARAHHSGGPKRAGLSPRCPAIEGRTAVFQEIQLLEFAVELVDVRAFQRSGDLLDKQVGELGVGPLDTRRIG